TRRNFIQSILKLWVICISLPSLFFPFPKLAFGARRRRAMAGTLWAWGSNFSGELGLGNVTNRSSPVQVGGLTNWTQIAAGGLGRKTDGTLWAWGDNASGQLGQGNTTPRSS